MTTISDPTGIEAVTWLTLRGALKLEALGLKKRGPSALAIARKRLGTTANRQQCLAMVEAKIQELKAQLAAERQSRTVPLMRDETPPA